MRLYTPHDLLYPITVTKLLKREGDAIKANEALFVYTYTSTVTEYDRDLREDVEKKRSWPANFESELEGTLSSLNVSVGQIIARRFPVAEVEEACKHEIQYGGICANCGMDMTQNTYNTSVIGTARATVNTVHGHTDLLISHSEATKADEEAKRRLLDSRKLSLVVDLDQTVIHAAVEPTIGEWQDDPTNPNHEAVKDVRKFQLIDEGPGGRGTWYYIKLRPGLQEFLEMVSKYYELHIYTMGTRAYAEHIAQIIDPHRRLFGDRILSRDENGSMTAKNLKRLFPVDTKMVVIIDDRADVWNWSPNLIKVSVYNFFVGIGDINSSFLPKQPILELRPTKSAAKSDTPETNGSNGTETATTKSVSEIPSAPVSTPNSEVSAVDQMVSMAGMQDAGSLQEKLDAQAQTIVAQVEDRPLLQQQKRLEEQEDEEAKASPAVDAATEELRSDNHDGQDEAMHDDTTHKQHRSLLRDDDVELQYLGQSLRDVHSAYFDEYDKQALGSKGGRIAELRPGQSKKRSFDDLDNIPDAAVVVQQLKANVLKGVHLVFTGIYSIGTNINHQEAVVLAKMFGATVGEKITHRTTHVIASPERRTTKVRQALSRPRIAIVDLAWLPACFQQWKKVNEDPFRIHQEDSGGAMEIGEDDLSTSDDNDIDSTHNDDANTRAPNSRLGKLAIDTTAPETDTDEDLEQYMPTFERNDSSPTELEQAEDWGDIDDELAEFLGSDADDDDDSVASEAESTRSEISATAAAGIVRNGSVKRKRELSTGESDSESEKSLPGGSRLQKRKKEALSRTTSLTNVVDTSTSVGPLEDAGAVNGSGSVGPGASFAGDESGGGDGDGIDDDDEDLEAALAAEMDRQSDEEE